MKARWAEAVPLAMAAAVARSWVKVTVAGRVAPAETVGRRAECFEFVLEHLAQRGVHLFHRVESRD